MNEQVYINVDYQNFYLLNSRFELAAFCMCCMNVHFLPIDESLPLPFLCYFQLSFS